MFYVYIAYLITQITFIQKREKNEMNKRRNV